jgi:hypothetical protein
VPILWEDFTVRDANIDREAARYEPEPGTRMLTSALVLFVLVLFATCLMAGIYMQAVARMAAR